MDDIRKTYIIHSGSGCASVRVRSRPALRCGLTLRVMITIPHPRKIGL